MIVGAIFAGLGWRASGELGTSIGGVFGLCIGAAGGGFAEKLRYFSLALRAKRELQTIEDEIEIKTETFENKIEDEMKSERTNAAVMIGLKALVNDEIDKSISEFELAQKAGVLTIEMVNGFGVALAKRGNLDSAVDKFSRAAIRWREITTPKINETNALLLTRDSKYVDKAVSQLMSSISNDSDNEAYSGRLGFALVQSGQFDKAIDYVGNVISAASKENITDFRNLLGLAYMKRGKYAEAMAEFQSSLSSSAGNAHAIANIGMIHLMKNDYENAIKHLNKSIEVDPTFAEARCNYGCALAKTGLVNEAILEIRRSMVDNPLLVENYYNLGKIYADEKLYAHAEKLWAKALAINPRLWQACAGMGLVEQLKGNLEMAMKMYREADKVSPNEAVVLGGVALCAIEEGEMVRAEELLRRAVKKCPTHSESLANIGWMLLNRGKHEASAEFSERAVKSSKKIAPAFNNLALCQYEMVGGLEAALKNFKRVLEISPEYKGIHYSMGHVYLKMDNIDAAVREWKHSIEKEPELADAYLNIGISQFKNNEFEQAIRSFQRVIEIRKGNARDFSNLGLACAKANHHTKAIEAFDKAIRLEPLDPIVHSNRGLACYFAKKVEEAMKEWQHVSRLNLAYFRSRSSKQQSEYDESTMDYAPLDIETRAHHVAPGIGDFLYAPMPGYAFSKWEMLLPDENLQRIADLKDQQKVLTRSLRAYEI